MNRMIAVTISPGATTAAASADLALAVEHPAAGGDEHEHERAEQLREQPSPLEARVFELSLGAELQRQQVQRTRADRAGGRELL